ncbi:sensor histidine kinase [Nocardia terpenica]|uniref:sensor histidine kinase n=1 Tax=Nocardia terpenica TaxID=455432 RepID=UPI000AE18108|nr:histidine kinase [Nocardia terpenica]
MQANPTRTSRERTANAAARRLLRSLAAVRSSGSAGALEHVRVRRSLARQSLLVALAAATVDTVFIALSGMFAASPAAGTAMVLSVGAVDLALAAPPSTAAAVTVAQVVLRVVAAWLLHRNGLPVRVTDVGYLVAGYRAGAWLSDRAALVAVPLLAIGASGAGVAAGGTVARDWRLLLITCVSAGIVPWLVGRYTAGRSAYIAELEQREQLRQQQQHAALDRALADEREAIARDLHDVISHHVSAIGIHAGAARLALAGDPGAATRSLTAVEDASRAAMVDLRRQLDLLHGRDEAGRRQPGLAEIEELVDTVRAAGLDVEVHTTGATAALPESLDVIVYRIVQELLTNALRHGSGSARLSVHRRPDRILIEETNPVAAHDDPPGSPHRGLDGIRRRADLFGGTVDHGRDPADRWRITVSIPIGAA